MKNILKVLLQIVKKKYPYLNYIFHNQFCDINIVHLSQYWKSKNDYYNILLIIYTKNIYEFILNWNKNIEEKKKMNRRRKLAVKYSQKIKIVIL